MTNDATTTVSMTPAPSTCSTARLRRIINEELPDLIEIRHDLHAHPELRYEESRTAEKIREQLTKHQIEFKGNLAGGTGTLAYLPGSDDSSAIGLRADMDALPIFEQNKLDYKSTNNGKMHACGHDGHTTILIGAARVLKRIASESGLPRSVKFIFQPAEEGGAGGKRMVQDGVLTDTLLGPTVSRMYGLHCWPMLEAGQLSTRPGPLLAAAEMFHLTIQGKGAHAAMPHYSHDPIVAASHLVTALQTIAGRNVDPLDSIVISVTMFHAGSATNIIPDEVKLGGTLRTLTDETRTLAKRRIREMTENIAASMECTASIEWEGDGYPVTENHPEAVEDVLACARAAVGENQTSIWPHPVMGGEDFAFYCKEVPSCFFLLGQNPPESDSPYPLVHTPVFNFNDDTIALGVEMFCRIALGVDSTNT